jgi:hypothetical protein
MKRQGFNIMMGHPLKGSVKKKTTPWQNIIFFCRTHFLLQANLYFTFFLTLLYEANVKLVKIATFCPASTIFPRWRQLFFPIAFGQ